MPKVRDRAVPHGTFTDHWIRVVASRSAPPIVRRRGDRPIEPFFERDEVGPEASIYQGLGEIVYATMANDGRVLGLAASALDRALAKDTARGEAHFLLGVAYQQLGRTNEAILALEHSLRVEPDNPEALHALAKAYELAGRPASAIAALYRRALGIQPALAWIRAEHAGFLQAQGLRDEAIEAYREALREQPSLAVAWFNLGTALAEAGPSVEASEAFRTAVHLDPELGQALSPLLEVRTAGMVVASVRSLGSPLPSLPVRDRGPRAVQLIVSESSIPRARFINLPPRALVDILTPDGTQVRALPAGTGGVAEWDFLTARGTPIAGGLYRARVQARDGTGRSLGPQLLYFGVVRQRVE
jgi:tetratricopeptide (TPR) repeat protein